MTTPVVIVGGGPVGLGLAIDLAQHGVESTVVEKSAAPPPIPKGQNLTQRTMEHFRRWGVESAIRAARELPAELPIAGVTAYGNLLSGYTHAWHRRELVRDYYAAANERLPQYETERVLRTRAGSDSRITLRIGWRATEVQQDDDGVRVVIDANGKTEAITGTYLVGCDGSRSLIRELCGIEQQKWGRDKRMALVLFRSPRLDRILDEFANYSYFNVLTRELEGYWKFFGRVDTDSRFFFHAPVPDDAAHESVDFGALLDETIGAEIEAQVSYVGFWDLRFAAATDFRAGRAFVAGDAAHSHPPYGGYGINIGLEDARNLGWKLAGDLHGWGGPALLDSYTAERRPVFWSTATEFIGRYIDEDSRFLTRYDPAADIREFAAAWRRRAAAAETDVQAYEPHYEGSPLIDGASAAECGAMGKHEYAASAGHHLAPQTLSNGDCISDVLGRTFTLLAFAARQQEIATVEASFAALEVPLTVLQDSAAEGRERYAARFVLVRPDTYVAWADSSLPRDFEPIAKRSVGRS